MSTGNYTRFPASGGGSSSNASVGTNGVTAPTSSTEIAGVTSGGILKPVVVDSSGNVGVNVENFPATQPVSGTVAVSSLPSIPAGANAIGSVSVSNFPPTQTVAGTVAVSTLPALVAGSAAIGTVGVTDLPSLPAGSNAIGNITTVSAVTAITNALPSGANNIGSITNITGTVSLPTGAATSALQTTGNTSLATIATNSGTQATAALQTTGNTSLATIATNTGRGQAGRASANAPVLNAYATTNITTSAYVQLVAATTAACNMVEVYNLSGSNLYLATGGSGSEVIQVIIPPGGNGLIPLAIAASTRVSAKAADVNATSGSLAVNFYA